MAEGVAEHPAPAIPEWGQPLSAWNATLWRTATGSPMMRSAMTGVFLLDGQVEFAALTDRLDRLTRAFPALRERVIEPIGGVGQPRMVVDPDFDLDFHVSHHLLPAPGSWEQLLGEVRRESMADLNRDRPLWRAALVDGLAEGRSAFLLVIHHAIADGQGALMIATGLLDQEGAALGEPAPMPPAPEPGRTDRATATVGAAADGVAQVGRLGLGALTRAPGAARDLLAHPRSTVGGAVGMAASTARVAQVHLGPLSPLMRGRSARYSTHTLDVPFDELRAAGRAHGATINDMLLVAVTAGLRRYHQRHDAPVDRLRINIPVDYRAPGHEAATNAASVARIDLAIAETSLGSRLAETQAAVRRALAEPALGQTELLGHVTRMLPMELLVRLAQGSDVTVSNVPGLPGDASLAGVRVERIYPFVPTFGAAANLTMLSHARRWCSIGIDTDDSAIPDPEVFVECLAEGFTEVGVPVTTAPPCAPADT